MATTAKKAVGNYRLEQKRRIEDGVIYKKGDMVSLSHLPQKDIKILVDWGFYTEVNN